jgi:uncharacterized protein YecA (UPF0149 family)
MSRRSPSASESSERLRRWSEHVRGWEHEIEVRVWRLEVVKKLAAQPSEARAKTGRNERSPCGSGPKYKHCHDLPGGRGRPPT